MIEASKIPLATLRRLPLYRRVLEEKSGSGDNWISSDAMAKRLGQQAIQVRKDLALTGISGRAKYGFPVKESIDAINIALGMNGCNEFFILGSGTLTDAVLSDEGISANGFKALAVFETDDSLVGAFAGPSAQFRIMPLSKLADLSRRMGVKLLVFAQSADKAQEAADSLAGSAIEAVLDISGVHPEFPEHIHSIRADFGSALSSLAAGLN